MNTQNLDKLMVQAETPPVWGENAADERLKELFATHGPALVAALKQCAEEVQCEGRYCYACDTNLPHTPTHAAMEAKKLLTQLEQEATCQK